MLGQEDVEVNAHREEETTQMDSQIRSGTIGSVGERGHAVRERYVVKRKKENN